VQNGGEWLVSCPGCFTPGKTAPYTCLIEGWVDPPEPVWMQCGEERKPLPLL